MPSRSPAVTLPFDRYVALGDSLSIDLYAARDAHPEGAAAPLASLPHGLGAAALLHRNDDARWPEFAGRDLATAAPGLRFRNEHALDHPARHPTDHYATDGATTVGVLAYQLHRVPASDERTLVTVTAGRSDVLQMLGAPRPPATMVEAMTQRLARLVRTVRERLPRVLLVLTTAPDPSDGAGRLDADTSFEREAGWLAAFNEAVRGLADPAAGVRVADAARHFAGHGLAAPPGARWFWADRPVELNARGASELRRVWWETVGGD